MSETRGSNLILLPLAGLIAAASLAGCDAGSLFRSKVRPPVVYQLAAPGPSAAAPSAAGSPAPASGNAGGAPRASVDLAVLKPRVRTGLDDDLIAVLYPDHRLDHIAEARWSGPLDEMLQDLILQAFRERPAVGVHADGSAFGSGYWLEVDIDDFQAQYGAGDAPPVIHVHAEARLGEASDRRVLGRFALDARVPAGANRVDSIVAAYNRALDEVLTDLVDRTLAVIAKTST